MRSSKTLNKTRRTGKGHTVEAKILRLDKKRLIFIDYCFLPKLFFSFNNFKPWCCKIARFQFILTKMIVIDLTEFKPGLDSGHRLVKGDNLF